jgi:glycosyltransferase involved in cell wall biosynthesis
MEGRDGGATRLRIVIVQPTPNSTTFGWESGFDELGHDVTLVTRSRKLQFGGRPETDLVELPDSRVSVRFEGPMRRSPFGLDSWPAPSAVRRLMRTLAPDLVLIKVDGFRNLVIAVVVHLMGLRTCIWQEQLPPLSRRWRLLQTVGLVPRAAFTALDGRPGGVAERSSETGLARISYVASPWRAAPRSREGRRDAHVNVLVVASFKNHEAKRQWWVLEAAAAAGLLDGRLRFTFMGYGTSDHVGYRRTQELVERYGIAHLVEFHFGVDHVRMPDVYDAHDVVVLPSRREQFGMTVVEAMARGLPVIVSDAVGAIGCVVPEETGLIFPVDDLPALADALRRCAEEPEHFEAMGRRAAEFADEHLGARRTAERILQHALSPPSRGGRRAERVERTRR